MEDKDYGNKRLQEGRNFIKILKKNNAFEPHNYKN